MKLANLGICLVLVAVFSGCFNGTNSPNIATQEQVEQENFAALKALNLKSIDESDIFDDNGKAKVGFKTATQTKARNKAKISNKLDKLATPLVFIGEFSDMHTKLFRENVGSISSSGIILANTLTNEVTFLPAKGRVGSDEVGKYTADDIPAICAASAKSCNYMRTDIAYILEAKKQIVAHRKQVALFQNGEYFSVAKAGKFVDEAEFRKRCKGGGSGFCTKAKVANIEFLNADTLAIANLDQVALSAGEFYRPAEVGKVIQGSPMDIKCRAGGIDCSKFSGVRDFSGLNTTIKTEKRKVKQ